MLDSALHQVMEHVFFVLVGTCEAYRGGGVTKTCATFVSVGGSRVALVHWSSGRLFPFAV